MLNRIELNKTQRSLQKSAQVSAYQMALVYLVIRFALSLADNFMCPPMTVHGCRSEICSFSRAIPLSPPRCLPYAGGAVRVRLGLAAGLRAGRRVYSVSPGCAPG